MKKILLPIFVFVVLILGASQAARAQSEIPTSKVFLSLARDYVLQGTDGRGAFYFYSESYAEPDEDNGSETSLRQTKLAFYSTKSDSVSFSAVEINCYKETIRFISVDQIGKMLEDREGNKAYKPKKNTFDSSLIESICNL